MSSLITRIKEVIFRRRKSEKVNHEHIARVVSKLKRAIGQCVDSDRYFGVCTAEASSVVSDDSIKVAVIPIEDAHVAISYRENGKRVFNFRRLVRGNKCVYVLY